MLLSRPHSDDPGDPLLHVDGGIPIPIQSGQPPSRWNRCTDLCSAQVAITIGIQARKRLLPDLVHGGLGRVSDARRKP
jgi:hypothetical protein